MLCCSRDVRVLSALFVVPQMYGSCLYVVCSRGGIVLHVYMLCVMPKTQG